MKMECIDGATPARRGPTSEGGIVTGVAHGGCTEPGGMELSDATGACACPRCGQAARSWHCERVEDGSVNVYSGLSCCACGHSQGDQPGQGD